MSMISELGRQSFFESSKTEFILSTHNESTGLSNSSHCFDLDLDSSTALLNMTGTSPLVYSFVIWLSLPYICSFNIDLGFMNYVLIGLNLVTSSVVDFATKLLIAPIKTFIFDDLPAPVGPTNINPCLTRIVS